MLNNEISHKYDDILLCRIPIPKIIRAWQEETGGAVFLICGTDRHEEAISETARLTDEKAALGEDVMERLDWIFMQIKAKMSENPEVTITYFLPDEKKAGGDMKVMPVW